MNRVIVDLHEDRINDGIDPTQTPLALYGREGGEEADLIATVCSLYGVGKTEAALAIELAQSRISTAPASK
jgi:hypothetical protein